MAKINLRESLNKIDLATDNKYDLLNTFDSKKLSDENKKKLAEAIDNNSIASINRVLHESEEQLYKVVISSGATKRNFESALYEDEAEGIVDYYGGRWIDENGFEWNMYVEEDDDSTEHAMIDDSYDIEDDDERAQREMDAYAQLDEDWGPNEWEETDFLDNDGKKVYINNIKEAEDIDDLKDIVHDLYWHDKGLFAMLRNFPKDKSFKWIQNRMIEVIKSTMNESLTEDYADDVYDAISEYDEELVGNEVYGFVFKSRSDLDRFSNYLDKKGIDNFVDDISDEDRKYFGKEYNYICCINGLNESLTEASYGGAYDIEDDMFFTKEDIVEFADNICDYLEGIFGYQYSIDNVYMDGPRKLYINIFDNNYIEVESTFDIDMRKIRKPSDLFKVYGLTIENWFQKAFAREYKDAGLDESLTEDTVKQNGKWVNKGSEGTHGKFRTKKAADAQRKAMFANGYKAESLNEQKYSSGNYFLTVDETGMGPHYSLYYQHPHSDYDGLMFIVDGYGYDNFKEKLSKFSTVYPDKDVQNLLKNINENKSVSNNDKSLEEKLIPAPQEVVDELLAILEKYDFVLDDSLKNPIVKTWSGNTHIQVINKNSNIEETDDPDIYSEQLMSYIPNSMTNDISRLSENSGCRITYSFGANRNWQITAGLDVWEKYVPGLQDESLKESIDISDYEKLHYPLRDGDKYYQLYRKIEDGRGVWAAAELDKYGSDVIGEPFKITYEQARGFEPIEDSSIRKLSRDLGKKLLPKRENLKEQINLPGYAVKYTAGYSGNGVNSSKTEWFRTKEERDRRAKELKDKNYTEIKTWEMDNFYHTPPKNESLKEAFDDGIDLDYETDFDDDSVEEGNVFIEGGVEYTWIQREAGPLYLDFDKWAVWSAREYVDPREFITIHDNGKDYDFDGDAFKKKAMAAPIVYFVVEEDTGFIDWGPEDNEIAAKDFLNGKQEDWDNDEYYGESLEKNLDEWYVNTIHYEDIGNGREYDYEVDHEEILDYLSEIAIDEEDAPEDTEEYLKWVENNFDELFNKYEYEIEEHFREDASQEEYDRRHSSYES